VLVESCGLLVAQESDDTLQWRVIGPQQTVDNVAETLVVSRGALQTIVCFLSETDGLASYLCMYLFLSVDIIIRSAGVGRGL
jgi:hypothetical protein